MLSIESGGARIDYTVHGDGRSSSSVMLPAGFTAPATSWRYQIPSLIEAGHRVIAVDLPGHGTAPATPHGTTMQTRAGFVHALIEGLDLQGAACRHVLCGQDSPDRPRHPDLETRHAVGPPARRDGPRRPNTVATGTRPVERSCENRLASDDPFERSSRALRGRFRQRVLAVSTRRSGCGTRTEGSVDRRSARGARDEHGTTTFVQQGGRRVSRFRVLSPEPTRAPNRREPRTDVSAGAVASGQSRDCTTTVLPLSAASRAAPNTAMVPSAVRAGTGCVPVPATAAANSV